MNLITPTYRELNSRLHSDNPAYGISSARWVGTIARMVDGPMSILDYGCGKGLLAKGLDEHGYVVREYDPAVPGKDKLPRPAELVVCTDVLEHVEPECLDDVLDHLKELTLDRIFFTISTRPAKKHLADGRNTHICLHDADWWRKKMASRFDILEWYPDGSEIIGLGIAVRELIDA